MDFPSDRSLGMHRHCRYPLEVNAERITSLLTKRRVWSLKEDLTLIRQANIKWKQDLQKREHLFLLQALNLNSPHSIMHSCRGIDAWKPAYYYMRYLGRSMMRLDPSLCYS